MMKFRILLYVCFFLMIFACGDNSSTNDIHILKNFEEKNVIDVTGDLLLELKYSNVIVYKNNKRLLMPIFRGDKGNIEMETIENYYIKNGRLEQIPGYKVGIGEFAINCNKGENKKTFYEFLNFYKSNILKNVDIEHPTCLFKDHDVWIIYYHYVNNGVPSCLKINIVGVEKGDNKYKSVYQIQPDENETGFIYSFEDCCK